MSKSHQDAIIARVEAERAHHQRATQNMSVEEKKAYFKADHDKERAEINARIAVAKRRNKAIEDGTYDWRIHGHAPIR